MTRNTDEACLDTVRSETLLTGCHDHRFEDGSDADPDMENDLEMRWACELAYDQRVYREIPS